MANHSIRDAHADDVDTILDLATEMWSRMGFDAPAGDWQGNFRQFFDETVLNGPNRVLVAEHQDNEEVIGCGVGVRYQMSPSFWLPNGEMGYIQWVVTRTGFERQGIATEIMTTFLDWFTDEGVTRVQLHATETGDALYRRLGFDNSHYPNLWWVAPGTAVIE